MERFFNIAGPCNLAKHYTLPAMARLPEVASLIREMALGKGALDFGVLFRGGKYAVEVKLKYNYEKNHEKAYDHVCRYMDHLGVPEGWLVVFDSDLSGDWDSKLSHEDIERGGRRVHLFRC